MSYCLNPNCPTPENPEGTKFCLTCGSKLLLRERYRALKPIGEGGMGRTFFAIDEDRLNAPCVIKQFFPQIQATTALQKATELFKREAEQLYALGEHPQITALYAYFEEDKRLYLVQEFIDGLNLLQELQQEGSFSEAKIRELLLNLLPLLQFIHDRDVIHRDIKPENILRRRISPTGPYSGNRKGGQLVLVDFGVAKQSTRTALGQSGTRAGTQGYAPMEQIRGGQAYPASDLYSLSVTCVQLLTGMMPEDLYNAMDARWVWKEQLHKTGMTVSPELAQILDKMLQEWVRDRYQSATEVLEALSGQTSAPPQPPLNPPTAAPAKPPQMIQSPPASKPIRPMPPQQGKRDPIAADLEAIKTHFSEAQPAKPPVNQKSPPTKTQAGGFDPIQSELEALKTEYGEER